MCWCCWLAFKRADEVAMNPAGIRQDMLDADIWLKPGAGKSTPGYKAVQRKRNPKVCQLSALYWPRSSRA